jgi:hypothetical protein
MAGECRARPAPPGAYLEFLFQRHLPQLLRAVMEPGREFCEQAGFPLGEDLERLDAGDDVELLRWQRLSKGSEAWVEAEWRFSDDDSSRRRFETPLGRLKTESLLELWQQAHAPAGA